MTRKIWFCLTWNVTGHKLRRSNYFEVFFSFQRGQYNRTTAMAAFCEPMARGANVDRGPVIFFSTITIYCLSSPPRLLHILKSFNDK